MAIIQFIRQNKLVSLLSLVIIFLLLKNYINSYNPVPPTPIPMIYNGTGGAALKSMDMALPSSRSDIMPPVQENYAPNPDIKSRMVFQNSDLSLLVTDVKSTSDKIISYTNSQSGYMVSSYINTPGESTTGNLTIRVPGDKLKDTLNYIRSLSVKVVTENLNGYDVTDQYVDIQSRLDTLNKTKNIFEDMLDKAVKVEDILNVQREIINLENQIDSYKGQQDYLKKTAETVRISIYLSTDEIALPYAPDMAWRPEVIFKNAVRDLVGNLRKVGTAFIWLVVYGVIWVPIVLTLFFIKKRLKKSDK